MIAPAIIRERGVFMQCPNCGAQVKGRFCEYCGSELPRSAPETINNDNSHTTIINNYYQSAPPQAEYANSHPIYQYSNEEINSDKSKIAALLLAIFLGYFGAHYFYVGKIGMGILYFFTAGLFGIGWIVDICRIASGSFKDSNGLHLKH